MDWLIPVDGEIITTDESVYKIQPGEDGKGDGFIEFQYGDGNKRGLCFVKLGDSAKVIFEKLKVGTHKLTKEEERTLEIFTKGLADVDIVNVFSKNKDLVEKLKLPQNERIREKFIEDLEKTIPTEKSPKKQQMEKNLEKIKQRLGVMELFSIEQMEPISTPYSLFFPVNYLHDVNENIINTLKKKLGLKEQDTCFQGTYVSFPKRFIPPKILPQTKCPKIFKFLFLIVDIGTKGMDKHKSLSNTQINRLKKIIETCKKVIIILFRRVRAFEITEEMKNWNFETLFYENMGKPQGIFFFTYESLLGKFASQKQDESEMKRLKKFIK